MHQCISGILGACMQVSAAQLLAYLDREVDNGWVLLREEAVLDEATHVQGDEAGQACDAELPSTSLQAAQDGACEL